jgi:uncharacterized protein (DUF1778 family)
VVATEISIDRKKVVATLIFMGRKKLPADERKGKVFRFRATDEERELIEAAASAAGKTSSEWAREILVKTAKKRVQKS